MKSPVRYVLTETMGSCVRYFVDICYRQLCVATAVNLLFIFVADFKLKDDHSNESCSIPYYFDINGSV